MSLGSAQPSDPHTEIREALEHAYDALRSGDTPRFKHLDEALAALARLEREAAERETAQRERAGKFLKRAEDAEARVREVEAERERLRERALARADTLIAQVREVEAERERLRERALARADTLIAIIDTPYGNFATKGDYAAFIRDLARAVLASPGAAAAEAHNVMLCAICSKPLNGAILNEDNKWVHPECEDSAEWHEDEDDEPAALPAVDAPPEPPT